MAHSSHRVLSYTDSFATSWADALMLVGRILVGFLFLTSGWSKLMNTAGAISYLTSVKAPAPEPVVWVCHRRRIGGRHYAHSRLGNSIRGAARLRLHGNRYRARPPLLGVSRRRPGRAVHQFHQEYRDPRRASLRFRRWRGTLLGRCHLGQGTLTPSASSKCKTTHTASISV